VLGLRLVDVKGLIACFLILVFLFHGFVTLLLLFHGFVTLLLLFHGFVTLLLLLNAFVTFLLFADDFVTLLLVLVLLTPSLLIHYLSLDFSLSINATIHNFIIWVPVAILFLGLTLNLALGAFINRFVDSGIIVFICHLALAFLGNLFTLGILIIIPANVRTRLSVKHLIVILAELLSFFADLFHALLPFFNRLLFSSLCSCIVGRKFFISVLLDVAFHALLIRDFHTLHTLVPVTDFFRAVTLGLLYLVHNITALVVMGLVVMGLVVMGLVVMLVLSALIMHIAALIVSASTSMSSAIVVTMLTGLPRVLVGTLATTVSRRTAIIRLRLVPALIRASRSRLTSAMTGRAAVVRLRLVRRTAGYVAACHSRCRRHGTGDGGNESGNGSGSGGSNADGGGEGAPAGMSLGGGAGQSVDVVA
jgi:hypothetical protein